MPLQRSPVVRSGLVVMLACAAACPRASAGPDEGKEKRGIIGVLADKEYEDQGPEGLRRGDRSGRRVGPERRGVVFDGLPVVDLDGLREEVERLRSQPMDETVPVSGIAAVERELARLRERHRAMLEDFRYVDAAEAERLADRRRAFNERWRPAARALAGDRPAGALSDAVTEAIADGGARRTRRRDRRPIDMPLGAPDRDAALEEAGLGHPPTSEGSKHPRLEPDIAPLAEAISRGERPEGVSQYDWARLSDAFEEDLSALDAEVASRTRARELEERRRERLEPLEEAIREAEEFAEKVKGFRDTLSEDEKKFLDKAMAWRLRKARLAAARQALRDAEALEKERAGRGARPDDVVRGGLGGAYEKVIASFEDAMSQMDAPAFHQPPSTAQMDEDGLRYPEWIGAMNLRTRVEMKLRALRSELAHLEYLDEHAPRVIHRRDRLKLRMKQFELEAHDRLRLRLREPQAIRRRGSTLRALARELRDTRAQRIAALQTEHDPRIEYLHGQIRLEQARLKKMDEASKPDPEPEPEPDPNTGNPGP